MRVTITRSYNTVVKEADFAVQNFAQVSNALLCATLELQRCSSLRCGTLTVPPNIIVALRTRRPFWARHPRRASRWRWASRTACTSSSSSTSRSTTCRYLNIFFSCYPAVLLLLLTYVCYAFQDVILGKIYFLLVRIKIKFMELAVIRREAAGKFFISSSVGSLQFE